MASRNRPHVFVREPAEAEPFRSPRTGRPSRQPTIADPRGHGESLQRQLTEADQTGRRLRDQTDIEIEDAVRGIYLTFESFPEIELALEPMDPRRGKLHPELRSVKVVELVSGPVEVATVFVPDGTLGHFLSRLSKYVETSSAERPRHRRLVERIRSVGLASLEGLWTDADTEFPPHYERAWWEVWLRVRDGNEVLRLESFVEQIGGRLGRQYLGFADRTVVLVEATADQLATGIAVLDDFAELRRPRQLAELLARLPAGEQADWVRDLAGRTVPAPGNAPAACVVDSGVAQGHPLLSQSLHVDDMHACDPAWGTGDHLGHGTQMAGLALYGDVGAVIQEGSTVNLRHRLESVKLLPPHGATPPELWGAVSATATSLVEVQAPERRRAFSLAITAESTQPADDNERRLFGQPTSWSATLDALAAGLSVDFTEDGLVYLDEEEEGPRRLFVVAAGNVRVYENDHLARSDLEPVEDPGQAWNAITVGAYTERDAMDQAGDDFAGWAAVAPAGELSPFSRTSVPFGRIWPHKPEFLLEGGNLAASPDATTFDTPDPLQLLTTKAPGGDARLLTVTNATSAATSQASRIAATVMAEYPELWPETVRALLVHSAEWTPAMVARLAQARTRGQRVSFLRRYGMGVADESRALRSATDSLTLVTQDVIHPFAGGRTREMHLHDLPWPTDVLSDLGSADVRLRVTLSYFVEPNPGRRGWQRRYAYPSHGLRFDVRRPTESSEDFRARVNALAASEEDRRPTSTSDSGQWLFGPGERTRGSLHSDLWYGGAAELAQRGMIAVYPVSGWWKERRERDHSERGARYSLVVSIETPGQDVDIWTPVAQEVGIPITIET